MTSNVQLWTKVKEQRDDGPPQVTKQKTAALGTLNEASLRMLQYPRCFSLRDPRNSSSGPPASKRSQLPNFNGSATWPLSTGHIDSPSFP